MERSVIRDQCPLQPRIALHSIRATYAAIGAMCVTRAMRFATLTTSYGAVRRAVHAVDDQHVQMRVEIRLAAGISGELALRNWGGPAPVAVYATSVASQSRSDLPKSARDSLALFFRAAC